MNSGEVPDTNSNVGICLQPSTTNWDRTFYISDNYFNGLSGTNSLVGWPSTAAADGFLYSIAGGVTCNGNTVSNSSFEGILMGSPTNGTAAVAPCYIYNNTVAKDISLASGWGIRCDVSGSQVYNNHITNSCYAFQVDSATNVSFYNNTATVASATFNFGFGFSVANAVNSSFTSNTFTLNLTNVCTSDVGIVPYNAGIAALGGSNVCFSNNTFTVSPAQYTNGYYGIAVDQVFLTNFNNIISNTFLPNGGLGSGVYATNYGPSYFTNYPNYESNSFIESYIATNNTF
jgi:hypothetical protein